jgi:beta-glucanase (GH16 family)
LAALALSILPAPRSGLAAAESPAAAPVGAPLGWRLAFEDNFDSLRLWDAKSKTGTWEPHYPWKARTNPSNSELQYYVDPRPGQDPEHFAELHPFTIDDNKLAIRARPLSPNQKNETGLKYASGLLTSEKSFSFTYGYVEIRAKIARGRGLWSAFWLAPIDHSWPPEIDVIEALGHDTKTYVKTAHTSVLGFHSQSQFRTRTPDLADAYHTYAVKWSDEEIIWYFEGRQVASTRTPGGANKPMYLIVNLAVGGNWPGSPDESTLFPAALEVDYIRVYLPPEAAS